MAFWSELKRRNVFKVGAAYAIVAWLLIQVAGQLMPTFEAPAWVLPVFTALVLLGFPLAIVLAWAYELTPEGIKKTRQVPLERSITATTGQKLNYIVTGLLVVAVGFVVVDTRVLDRTSVGNPGDLVEPASTTPAGDGTSLELANVIAVLPFEIPARIPTTPTSRTASTMKSSISSVGSGASTSSVEPRSCSTRTSRGRSRTSRVSSARGQSWKAA